MASDRNKLAHQILQKYWGYDGFRPLQLDIILSIDSGKDTFGLLTTGGGKSICYQVPAMMREGLCLVVSPLIALIKDQVMQLRKRKIPSTALYSSLTAKEMEKIYQGCAEGKVKFLYVSPERLQSKSFKTWLRQMPLSMVAVDEAHCISQWGYDFRPPYMKINEIRTIFPSVPIIALTATATPRVVDDVIEKLSLKSPVIIKSSFFKPNLSYQIIQTEEKKNTLLDLMTKNKGSNLVYVNRRSSAEEVSLFLKGREVENSFYHAGLSFDQRKKLQENWIASDNSVMICTNAFGMGIDNPKVRLVVHYHLPLSIEAYFQEAGRAGRDGRKSNAITILNQRDRDQLAQRLNDFPSLDFLKSTLQMLYSFYDIPYEHGEGQHFTFNHFLFYDKYKLDKYQVNTALDLLELMGLIEIEDAYYRPAKLQMLMTSEELVSFTSRIPEFHQFLKQIIQTFEGIFTMARPVDLEYFSKRNHYTIKDVKAMLSKLHKHEVVDYTPPNNAAIIHFLIPRPKVHNTYLDTELYFQRKAIFEHQTKAMIDFVNLEKGCRSQFLLSYFGEENSAACGQCDLCQNKQLSAEEVRIMAIECREWILENIDSKAFVPFEKIQKNFKKTPEWLLRKVLDRMLELGELEKGIGQLFKRKK